MTFLIRIIRSATCIGLLGALTACVSVQPTLDTDAVPDPKAAYVSGEFSRVKLTGIAYVVESVDSKTQYLLPMGKDTSLPSAVSLQTVAMQIPAGTYHIVEWVTYATITKEIFRRVPVKNPWLSKPFTLKAGSVLHLGRFSIEGGKTVTYPNVHMQWSVQPQRISLSDAVEAFSLTYPKLANLPISCLLCIDTVLPETGALQP
jgi:hypothetical protein